MNMAVETMQSCMPRLIAREFFCQDQQIQRYDTADKTQY